jgi:ElaB/YqjD/DUF883 family membrane-anchored ribosome-binding protein
VSDDDGEPVNTLEASGRAIAKTRSRAKRAKREVAAQVDSFFGDVEDLLQKVGESTDEEVILIRSKVQDAMREAREAVDARSKKARKSARTGARIARKYVRDNPWASVGLALTIGALIGLSLNR